MGFLDRFLNKEADKEGQVKSNTALSPSFVEKVRGGVSSSVKKVFNKIFNGKKSEHSNNDSKVSADGLDFLEEGDFELLDDNSIANIDSSDSYSPIDIPDSVANLIGDDFEVAAMSGNVKFDTNQLRNIEGFLAKYRGDFLKQIGFKTIVFGNKNERFDVSIETIKKTKVFYLDVNSTPEENEKNLLHLMMMRGKDGRFIWAIGSEANKMQPVLIEISTKSGNFSQVQQRRYLSFAHKLDTLPKYIRRVGFVDCDNGEAMLKYKIPELNSKDDDLRNKYGHTINFQRLNFFNELLKKGDIYLNIGDESLSDDEAFAQMESGIQNLRRLEEECVFWKKQMESANGDDLDVKNKVEKKERLSSFAPISGDNVAKIISYYEDQNALNGEPVILFDDKRTNKDVARVVSSKHGTDPDRVVPSSLPPVLRHDTDVDHFFRGSVAAMGETLSAVNFSSIKNIFKTSRKRVVGVLAAAGIAIAGGSASYLLSKDRSEPIKLTAVAKNEAPKSNSSDFKKIALTLDVSNVVIENQPDLNDEQQVAVPLELPALVEIPIKRTCKPSKYAHVLVKNVDGKCELDWLNGSRVIQGKEYESRAVALAESKSYAVQSIDDLNLAEEVGLSFTKGKTLYPFLTDVVGMNRLMAFKTMDFMIENGGIDVDGWNVGDSISFSGENGGTIVATHNNGIITRIENVIEAEVAENKADNKLSDTPLAEASLVIESSDVAQVKSVQTGIFALRPTAHSVVFYHLISDLLDFDASKSTATPSKKKANFNPMGLDLDLDSVDFSRLPPLKKFTPEEMAMFA